MFSRKKNKISKLFLCHMGIESNICAQVLSNLLNSLQKMMKSLAKASHIFLELVIHELLCQSELPRPIPRNFMELDHICTSRIYFDNVGDNVMLKLYNVTLTLCNVMLTSQKSC